MLNQLEYKKLKYEIKLLSLEVEELKNVFDKAITKFESEFRKVAPEYEKPKREIKVEIKESKTDKKRRTFKNIKDEVTKKEPENKKAKQVYRRIVSRTHPDKLGQLTNKELKKSLVNKYKEAINKYNDNDVVGLYDLADELDIKLPEIDESHIMSMKEKVEVLKKQINTYRKSNALIWYNSDDREGIMKQIVQKLKSEGRL
tara:strand:+ start:2417 stop:3019 length:603 start_codon:yes stop_codon:yes gene_type:complete